MKNSSFEFFPVDKFKIFARLADLWLIDWLILFLGFAANELNN